MQAAINGSMTIEQIVTQYPQTISVFESRGFKGFSDPNAIQTVGRFLKLESLLKRENCDHDAFIRLLEQAINNDNTTSLSGAEDITTLKIAGLLPCPVRVPLQEALDSFAESYRKDYAINVESQLEAAAIGAQWIEEHVTSLQSHEELPDILLSAGFETFFDPKLIGRWKDQGVFVDTTGTISLNTSFDGVDIRDPQGDYGIISVVPSVFVVHQANYPDIEPPRCWADILEPRLEGLISLPVSDFDLFNGILLNIHKEYGDQGLMRLARSMSTSLHPAQMVHASNRRSAQKPFVSIMPYFFTKMLRNPEVARCVWPEDGSIISPVFMLVKKDQLEHSKPLADFFAGKEVGNILTNQGLFPSLNAAVINNLPTNPTWKWIGWDYLYANDIGALLQHVNEVFRQAVQECGQ
ncbi:ABC transporter substrate-binding protein [Desulfurispira natronophila]|uniref:ABC-type Fe3+ transport system substrate-binding protein n=1 Tax=Desulfurispira natronophila TaxID=682562 RepID=A0A7W7Y2I3_9BACT|nr:ABC transporter substrate-binding protein [Desulfurispira natronophila]MBB5020886.1 ABC-type Fe3+ transport system substrate-binding protein [Desulfurispira natronophila]